MKANHFYHRLIRYLLFPLILAGCSPNFSFQNSSDKLISIHLLDQNGMSETIGTPDRLKEYENVDFFSNQPYAKIMRVFGRDDQGNTHSCITTYYSNGQLKQYLEVLNNRAQGYYREWHENGCQKLEAYVVGGEADINTAAENTWHFDGNSSVWDENGALIASITYDKGLIHGPSVYYHPNGQTWKNIPYLKGEINGLLEIFLDSGALLQRMEYCDGKLHGPAYRYWTPGKYAAKESYKNDLLIEGQYWQQDGSLISEVQNGTGHRATFTKSGLFELQQYQDGTLNGEVQVYGENGKITRLYHIKNGLKHGEELEYYPQNPFNKDTHPKLCISWYEGKIHGTVKTWYENGLLESQREVAKNLKNGLATAWYRDGSLMLIEEYDQNNLLKGEYFKKGEKYPTSTVELGCGTATLYDGEGNFLHRVSYHKGAPDDLS